MRYNANTATQYEIQIMYIEQQLIRVAPFPVHENDNGQLRLKLHSARGETHWLNITPEQFKRIEEILLSEAQ